MGKIMAVNISEERGTQKKNVHSARLIEDWGIEHDAHAGKWHRQVSLLSYEKIEEFRKKGAPVDEGAFGENLLDTILQSCGMKEGIHYTKQFVTTSECLSDSEEHVIRPDVVINLPNDRHVIVDSKVTLRSYLACADDKDKIKDFKSEVRKRITDLSNKNYQSAENLWQPDFVLMYMPVEPSLQLLYQDFDLVNFAYKSNVIIVGTASLLATIRLVNQLFAQQKQCECVNHIVQAGTNLFETFVQFCDDLVDVQKRFDDVNKRLNTTINRFRRGNKNKPSLFSQVEALKDYGINTNKEIPSQLLESGEESQSIIDCHDSI